MYGAFFWGEGGFWAFNGRLRRRCSAEEQYRSVIFEWMRVCGHDLSLLVAHACCKCHSSPLLRGILSVPQSSMDMEGGAGSVACGFVSRRLSNVIEFSVA